MRIYVAGKEPVRAKRVMDALREHGHEITYDWIESLDKGPLKEIADAEARGVRNADLLVYLWEIDQESARYEAGMAMGLQKPIIVSGKDDAFFFQLDGVTCVESDDSIVQAVMRSRK